MSVTLNGSQIYKLLGFDNRQQFSNFILDNPDAPRQQNPDNLTENLYDLAVFLPWFIGSQVTPEKTTIAEQRLRKITLEADKIQVDIDKERGLLLDAAATKTAIAAEYMRVKQKILSLAYKAAPLLVNMDEQKEIEVILQDYIKEVLEELSLDGE